MFRKNILLILIFLLALVIRFSFFRESTYFGFDEARDAFTSQEIYKNLDLKIIGPPANFPGLYHGPLHWYLMGPLYLLSGGNHYFVSAIFRILNALGVFLVYLIAFKFFNKKVALIAALLYSFSFEQTQYAMYVGHPALSAFSFLIMFYGASLIYKDKDHKGLILMFVGSALAIHFELVAIYIPFVVLALLILLKDKVRKFSYKYWIVAFGLSLVCLSNFLVAEIRYDFQSAKALLALVGKGYRVMDPQDTAISLYIEMFLRLMHDNLVSFLETKALMIVALAMITLLLVYLRRNKSIAIIFVWVFGNLVVLPFVSYNSYYANLGLGVGLIVGASFLISLAYQKSKALGILIVLVVLASNLHLILTQNKNSLIKEIKAQEFMKLSDELKVLDKIYSYSSGLGFTVRVTSMPYKIQTTWAYLFEFYGKKHWGYLPYWETELVQGYLGSLPRPVEGTTCIRFLIREPVRGIPEGLIKGNVEEENIFSKVVKEEYIGHFLLQYRQAHGECHNLKP